MNNIARLTLLLSLGVSTQAMAQSSASPFTTATRYDDARRVTGTIAPDPASSGTLKYAAVRNTYDPAGRLIRVEKGELANWKDENTLPSAWGSDFTGQLKVETSYDAMSRKLKDETYGWNSTISAWVKTFVTQYSYDSDGRLDCTAVRMNASVFASLPGSACTLGTAGSQGPDRITRNSYDASGQLLKVRRAFGTALEQDYANYGYTANGKQKSVIDANGNKATMTFDGHDRQVRWNFPDKVTAGSVSSTDYEEYAYDANGNRTSLRKRDGQVIGYSYDAANRVTVKDIPGGTAADVYYGYDLRGLQTEARFASITGSGVTNGWDGFGGQKSSSTNMSGTAWTLTYQSDADGNRTRVQHPDSNSFTYSYDGLDRMEGISENGSTAIAALTYNPRGLPAGATRGGVTTSYSYDKTSRLTMLSDDLASTSNDVSTGFGYNPASQITLRTRDNDSYAFGSYATASKAYTANGLNQYTAVAGASLTYDANGNLTSDGTTSYTYDVENRLVAASGGVTLSYDPLGRLYETAGSTTTRFLYDGDELVGEYNSSGTLQRRYVHGRGDDDPVIWYEGSGLSTRRSLQSDHQGSIVSVADSSGAAVQLNAYDEYGNPGSSNLGRFQYTGQAWLPDLGMYYYKARIYDPKTGRFLQVDPIGYEDQVNLYAYVGSDPMGGRDPSGTSSICADSPTPCGYLKGGPNDELFTYASQGSKSAIKTLFSIYDPDLTPGKGHNNPPPDDPPPPRPITMLGRLLSTVGLILSLGGDTCPSCNITLDSTLNRPSDLTDITLDQFRNQVGTPSGWVWTKSLQGTNAGKGWALREWGGKGFTGRMVRWHPGGARKGIGPYWRVNNGHGDSNPIKSGGRW